MGLMSGLRAFFVSEPAERATVMPPRPSFVDNSWPFVNFGGSTYPLGLTQTLQGKVEPIGSDFEGLVHGAYRANGIVFACMLARLSLFSEARFMYRRLRSGTPGELFSLPSLEILRTPWPGGTAGDLLSRAIQDADLGGNAFFLRRPDRIVRLRPDWMWMVYGSPNDPELGMWDPESELMGYAYYPGGPANSRQPRFYQPSQVAHFAPNPDPIAPHRGMSWLTPIIREIQADSAMTDHKSAYLMNGATVNLVVTGVPATSREDFAKWIAEFEAKHKGPENVAKTLYLAPSMDAKAVGSNLVEADMKAVQGAGETRIAAAAGVPAAVVGISEGLAGSSLNAGNFAAAMRRFADLTMRPAWRNIAGSLAAIVNVPGDAELWYDDRDIPALKDDIKDAAEVQALQAQAVRQYVDAGFEPDTVIDAVNAGDLKRLKHSGLYSVQLQLPVPEQPVPEPAAIPDQLAPFVKPAEEPAAGRDAALWEMVAISERRADAAERRAETPAVVNVTSPEVTVHPADVNVTIERGAVEVSNPVTITTPDVNVTSPDIHISAPVTIERGAVQVDAPVTIAEGAITSPDITVNVPERSVEPAQITISEGAVRVVEHVLTRTVIDTDPETGDILGSHEELIDE